ncbi:MAG: nucleotidyltransferase family protein [Pseudomonadales bacterium]
MKIGAIILAAGSSRRFGGDKRKAQLDNGNSVLVTTIKGVAKHFEDILLVLRHDDEIFANQLKTDIGEVISNTNFTIYCAPDSSKGMAHSLANGITQVTDWDAAAIFLGDMPFLQSASIELLIDAMIANIDSMPIVIPYLDGKSGNKPGHPVIFHKQYFEEIARLSGDRGAKAVIDANRSRVVKIQLDDLGVLKDIDTREDLGELH